MPTIIWQLPSRNPFASVGGMTFVRPLEQPSGFKTVSAGERISREGRSRRRQSLWGCACTAAGRRQETIWAAVDVLRARIERFGIPQALYTDWKNVYVRVANAAERVTG